MPSKGAGGDELAAAQEELDDAEQGGRVSAQTPWQSIVEVCPLWLIFWSALPTFCCLYEECVFNLSLVLCGQMF